VELIGATTTKTGLKVGSELDQTIYKKGIEVTQQDFDRIPIEHKTSRPELNYVIKPGLKL